LLIRANIGLIILEGQAPFMAFTLQTTDFWVILVNSKWQAKL
jgi:hypothetical protein